MQTVLEFSICLAKGFNEQAVIPIQQNCLPILNIQGLNSESLSEVMKSFTFMNYNNGSSTCLMHDYIIHKVFLKDPGGIAFSSGPDITVPFVQFRFEPQVK